MAGSYHVELTGYPDEPGHFVTGMLFEDYLKTFPPQPVMSFAKEYYIHRPKVAIGHWPPVLYFVEGIWFVIFHATRGSALALMALITAALAASIYSVVRPRHGTLCGLAAGIVFLGLATIQWQTSQVMADLLVALLGFWATVKFAEFLDGGKRREMLYFAGLALLAIFTKNNGLYLALVPPAAIVLTRKYEVLRNRWLWLGGLAVAAPSGAWVLWSRRFVESTWTETAGLPYFFRALGNDLRFLYTGFGWPLLILLLVGVVRVLVFRGKQGESLATVLISTAIGVILFQSLAPAGIEPRFMTPAIAVLIPVLFQGVAWAADQVPARSVPVAVRALAIVALAAILSPRTFATSPKAYRGFSEVADFVESDPQLRQGVILVSSDRDGEGLLISEIAMRSPYTEGFILRASKVLAEEDWLGRSYQTRFPSSQGVGAYLEDRGVDLVVLDQSGAIPDPPHQQLLLEAVQEYPNVWQPAGTFPQGFSSDGRGSRIALYRRTTGKPRSKEKVHEDMLEILDRKLDRRQSTNQSNP